MYGKIAGFAGPLSPFSRRSATPADIPSVGTAVAWTQGTYFDSYTSQSGVTTSDLSPTNNMCWQLFYAWKDVTIGTGAVGLGVNTYANGTNSIQYWRSTSSATSASGSFPSATQIGSSAGNFSYSAGGFNEVTPSASSTITAGKYFLIGTVNGPYYRTFKTLAANRTAQVSGVSYVTALNRIWYGPWPSGPTSGIPNQIGGPTSGYTEYNGYVPVMSVKFS